MWIDGQGVATCFHWLPNLTSTRDAEWHEGLHCVVWLYQDLFSQWRFIRRESAQAWFRLSLTELVDRGQWAQIAARSSSHTELKQAQLCRQYVSISCVLRFTCQPEADICQGTALVDLDGKWKLKLYQLTERIEWSDLCRLTSSVGKIESECCYSEIMRNWIVWLVKKFNVIFCKVSFLWEGERWLGTAFC